MSEATYRNLNEVIGDTVERNGHRRVFGTKRDGRWQWITYRELGERIAAFRGGLHALGVRRGDTVAMISGNRVEWAVAAYATYGLGARFCPMYENQLPKDWEYILTDSQTKVLITSTYPIYDEVREWPNRLEHLESVFCMALPVEDEAGFLSLEERGRKAPVEVQDVEAEEICGFIYTSGTTGKPKGVLLSHGNICSNVNAVNQIFPIEADDTSLCFLPWAHSFGQTCELHCMLAQGAGIAFVESIENLVPNLGEVKPTILFSVPRIWNRIYDGLQKKMAEAGGLKKALFDAGMANAEVRRRLAAEGKTSTLVELKHKFFDGLVFSKVRERFGGRLRYAISGGAALSREVAEFIDKLGIFVCEGYGLTETSPICTANVPGGRKIGSVGRPIPGVEVIIDTSVVDNPESGDGEIVVRGPNVMQGYHGLEAETAEVLQDGKFRTGDLGRLDADNYLYITGRIKEQYKLENGKYVVPAPLEETLQLSPFISQAFVFGDNKPWNVALVVPDRASLEGWARGKGLPSEYDDLLRDPKVVKLLDGEVEAQCNSFKGYERVRKSKLVAEEFSVENGMLTPKMSLKRNLVTARYQDDLDALYA